ncbi:MAG TPA: HAMP domain-containing sensor histidine kinase, partial [Chitinophagaceae bacterium]|nr:HAMP domain-containing sensor histidine kinase [Chitinophagaceae bacterium]
KFTIPYRWFQQPWFRIVASLFILLLVIFIHNLRIWYLRKRKKALEELVKRKTSELQETNENLMTVITELGESETSLKQSNFLKDEYYAVLTHDLRSPLKFLSFNLSQLLELLPELTNQAIKKGLLAAHQSSNDVYKLVDEFVYWIQDNEKLLQTKALPTVINAVITDIKKLYGFSFESNGNTLLATIPPELRFSTDPKMLFIVLRNAVDNANKYTVNGTISVSATLQNSILQLIVADTGKGMNSEMVQELTDLQHRKEQLDYKQRKSLGFYIMAMLTKKLGGSYTITSVKGKGTSVCFMLHQLTEE